VSLAHVPDDALDHCTSKELADEVRRLRPIAVQGLGTTLGKINLDSAVMVEWPLKCGFGYVVANPQTVVEPPK
jgi:hypothetical protein